MKNEKKGKTKKEGEKQEMREKEVVVRPDYPIDPNEIPRIDMEILDRLIHEAESNAIWVKPKTGGFAVDERIQPELIGVIMKIDPYFVKWQNGEPDKFRELVEGEAPEDYEPRCDIFLLTPKMMQYGISLARSSFHFSLCPYIKALRTRGYEPTQVVSRLWTKDVTNKKGTFTVVKFECAETLELIDRTKQKTVDPKDDIPF